MPAVSIITPCFNSATFLPETIASVLAQTFTDWQWLITDDCSTDESVALIRQTNDARIVLTVSERNVGAGAARNLSLEKATGRFITFLDADDFWEPTFLEEMIAFMKESESELAYSSYARCNENLEPVLGDFTADTVVTFNNLLRTCRLSLL